MVLTFAWDEAKASANLRKHGVSFDAAPDVFSDERRHDAPDDRFDYGEARRNVTGVADGVCLTITYAQRGGTARIISARRASRKERAAYDHRSQDA